MNYTEYCPNCDAKLPARLWAGDETECQECGETVTFTARPETKTGFINPEQQLTNLANLVKRQTTPTRRNVGRGDNYAASKQEIAETARQLAEYVLIYLAGELKEIDGDLEF